jgi:hypothetical protein
MQRRLAGAYSDAGAWVTAHASMTQDCHTRFLRQNRVLIVCMTHDQLFHTYG